MTQSIICPRFEKAISLLSQRWTALIINQILSGPRRFCALQSSIGISGKVLSERLKDLEQQGFINREVIPETPVIIEYSLTEKGCSLEPILKEIGNWSRSWVEIESEET
jgi:DNA-binding HxlR family transcriptional regulator